MFPIDQLSSAACRGRQKANTGRWLEMYVMMRAATALFDVQGSKLLYLDATLTSYPSTYKVPEQIVAGYRIVSHRAHLASD